MKLFIKISLTISILSSTIFSQSINLKGIVIDNESGLPIEGVNIILSEGLPQLSTDHFGKFSLSVEPGTEYRAVFSKIGYKSHREIIKSDSDNSFFEIKLIPGEIILGEVTVTSTRYSKLEKDVSIPIEVIGLEKLEKNLSLTVPDILNNEPGITVVRDGIWGTDINIRGLSRQNVVTLVDGNRIETATNHAAGLSLIDMFDIERIEVIKGGVSSLYGTGATGGVVNVITRRVSYTNDFHLSGIFSGGYNSVNKGGIGNLSINASGANWFLKTSGSLRSAVNTNTPKGKLPNSQFHDNYLSGTAGYRPFENHELKLSYQNFSGEDIGIPGGKTFPQSASAKYLLVKREMYSAEYRINNLFPSLVSASVKYFFQKIRRNVELKPNATTTSLPRADHNTNGLQLQTNWYINNFIQIASGIDAWQREYKGFRETIVKSATINRITADYPVPDSKYLSTGLFLQNESRLFNNKLIITLGGRFDLIKVTNSEVRNPAYVINNGVTTYPPANPQASFNEGKYNDQSWSGNIGILHSVANGIDLAFNFAHAFRSPVLEERFQYINLGGDVYLGNPDLNSEQGNFIDAGFRVWNDVISFKSNFFYNSFIDLVIDKPVIPDSLYMKDNVGKAVLYGFDLGLESRLINHFVIFASASFVRGEDTENNVNLPQVPPFNGRIGFRTNLPEYFSVELASTFFTKQNNVAFGEKTTPGYVLLDFYISSMPFEFNLFSLKIYAGVENILDKDYRNHLSTNRGSILNEPGRNFFVKTALSF
ncbi:MAG: TonB-dependent receptor [Ignavibacteriaceae bacterium]|nr:TonB-dependent receptor [Ignavibacteriaceae bacterium]